MHSRKPKVEETNKLTTREGASQAHHECQRNGEHPKKQIIHRVLLVIIIQRDQNCNSTPPKFPKFKNPITNTTRKKLKKKKKKTHTDKRGDNEKNKERQTTSSIRKETRNWVNRNNNSSNSNCEKQLNTNNRIYFPNKRPPELRVFHHHWVQRPAAAAFHVMFPVRLGPHPSENSKNFRY